MHEEKKRPAPSKGQEIDLSWNKEERFTMRVFFVLLFVALISKCFINL